LNYTLRCIFCVLAASIFTVFVLYTVGCSDKKMCEFSNGAKTFVYGNNFTKWDCANDLYGEVPKKTYKGGLTWGIDLDLSKIKCSRGKVLYPRIQISTSFPSAKQSARVGWQCFISNKDNTLIYLKEESTSLKDLVVE